MKWIISKRTEQDVIDQILLNRGIKNKTAFLEPNFFVDQEDPRKMIGVKSAIKRICQAVENKEKIGIFGDYDADGIPATALLYNAFRSFGVKAKVYIPFRSEGYGLSLAAADFFIKEKCQLVIVLDAGITAQKEAEYFRKNKIDLIIIDHHLIQKDKYPAAAHSVIDPHQDKESYAFRDFCGGGLAWKILYGLFLEYGWFGERQLKWWLDLAAIATIADYVPLVGENRLLAKFGLLVLARTKNIGLRELYNVASIEQEKISSYSVGFQIAPRINAAGRIDHADLSFYLLTETDSSKLKGVAEKINSANQKRQAVLEKALKKAKKIVEKEGLSEKKLILLADKEWGEGIVGLVAAGIMERYNRPTIALAIKDKIAKGSGRSLDFFHLEKALEKCRRFLVSFGGHKKAAGLRLESKNIQPFYEHILKIADKEIKDGDLLLKINIDAELGLAEITPSLYGQLKKMEPFGMGNSRPVFISRGLRVAAMRRVGRQEKHLRLQLSNSHKKVYAEMIECIGFDLGCWAEKIAIGDDIDIAYTIDKDDWNGRERLQLKIIDIKK